MPSLERRWMAKMSRKNMSMNKVELVQADPVLKAPGFKV